MKTESSRRHSTALGNLIDHLLHALDVWRGGDRIIDVGIPGFRGGSAARADGSRSTRNIVASMIVMLEIVVRRRGDRLLSSTYAFSR